MNTRLDHEQVASIRQLCADGVTQVALAKQFNVAQCTISEIVRGKTYASVPTTRKRCIDCRVAISTARTRCRACTSKARVEQARQWRMRRKAG